MGMCVLSRTFQRWEQNVRDRIRRHSHWTQNLGLESRASFSRVDTQIVTEGHVVWYYLTLRKVFTRFVRVCWERRHVRLARDMYHYLLLKRCMGRWKRRYHSSFSTKRC